MSVLAHAAGTNSTDNGSGSAFMARQQLGMLLVGPTFNGSKCLFWKTDYSVLFPLPIFPPCHARPSMVSTYLTQMI